MYRFVLAVISALFLANGNAQGDRPHPFDGGYQLPNGWRITPIGKAVPTEDLVLNVLPSPDGRAIIAMNSGFNPHGLVVIDAQTEEAAQRIPLKSTWLGMAWSPDGTRLFVSGGNASSSRPTVAPIYVFSYTNGRLSEKPVSTLQEDLPPSEISWSGLAHHPQKPLLYAANRGTGTDPGSIAVFNTQAGNIEGHIPVEVTPYDLVLDPAGQTLYVSNWSSDSVSVIDTDAMTVTATIPVGDNPNDLELAPDGRLFVSCASDNSVFVVDTKTRRVTERLSVGLTPHAPAGSTPNALTLDWASKRLYVANADNNCVAVVDVEEPGRSEVEGFIPSGWYPSALAIGPAPKRELIIGNSKGPGSYSDIYGPHSPLPHAKNEGGSVKSLQKGSVNFVDVSGLVGHLVSWTKQVFDNCPYRDDLLAEAKPSGTPSIVPRSVGKGSPIKHVLYIIKENRTYDQILGDIGKGESDPRLTIFGKDVTPNHHALANQFALLDNLYCDGEVSEDGHSWSDAAYATDYNEKNWPSSYGGRSKHGSPPAFIPGSGFLWDQCLRKGLIFRCYGEYCTYSKEDQKMVAQARMKSLNGHVAPQFKSWVNRDPDNAADFIREFDDYESNYDSQDRQKRLPNLMVMSLPEDHTRGTMPGQPTPRAAVASNDAALGKIVERVTRSKYWPETAIFVIEDDAQDGSDHVDARRTVGLVLSPYIKRGTVDSTLYTTSSFLRTIELLLGLPPMTQYDAAATPLYASFGTNPDLSAYAALPPIMDLSEKNTPQAVGAKASLAMDFSDVDRTPMRELNEVIWKSVKGASATMPPPVHRFRFPFKPGSKAKDDDD